MESLHDLSIAHRGPEPKPSRSADFQVCRIAGFQTCGSLDYGHHADLEIGDTAGLETCATIRRFMEREQQSPISQESLTGKHSPALENVLPLLGGEGRGEASVHTN